MPLITKVPEGLIRGLQGEALGAGKKGGLT
jgi:hypothetical protein